MQELQELKGQANKTWDGHACHMGTANRSLFRTYTPLGILLAYRLVTVHIFCYNSNSHGSCDCVKAPLNPQAWLDLKV